MIIKLKPTYQIMNMSQAQLKKEFARLHELKMQCDTICELGWDNDPYDELENMYYYVKDLLGGSDIL